jgi:hypothetical protein
VSARDVLDRLTELGATLERDGDRLRLHTGPAAVPAELAREIKEAKPELLELLGGGGRHLALVEPLDWRREGIPKLLTMWPAAHVPLEGWRGLLAAVDQFVEGWDGKAEALGWGAIELFGCHRTHPWPRLDCLGALWLVNRDLLVAITAISMTTRRRATGSSLVIRRRMPPGTRVVCAWDLPTGGGE